MQTFLPYKSFLFSAKCLDKRRLFKQLIEARQILATLGEDVRKIDGSKYKATHKNHPAVKMWKGYEAVLQNYHNEIWNECKLRGINVSRINKLNKLYQVQKWPKWLGNSVFHKSHQSNLVRKNPDHYRKYFPIVPNNLDYIWPRSS